jgi:hypothetical protein
MGRMSSMENTLVDTPGERPWKKFRGQTSEDTLKIPLVYFKKKPIYFFLMYHPGGSLRVSSGGCPPGCPSGVTSRSLLSFKDDLHGVLQSFPRSLAERTLSTFYENLM